MASTDTLEKVSEIPASEIEYKEYCGSGSYGAVRCAVWKDKLVAVKIPHRNENDDEIRHLTVLNHSNIIKFFGIVKKDKKHSLVMEFSEIGSLSRILHERIDVEYSLSHVINWCLQTACGLAYLHSLKPRPMMHRDLKPQNILLFDDGKIVKLCDFGTLRRVDTQVTQERGSIAYMAPEVIKTQHYSEKCDVYSWGVLLWEMVTRERPYSDREFYQVYFAVCNGHRLQLPQKVHPIFLKLMTFSWDDKPEKRPDMKTVQEIMQQLFAIVVDENDPSRCTSLNIPNLNDKATDSNDENSVSDSCEMSQPEEQSRIDLKARQLQRMASTNSIITNINHCFFNQSEKPYISDCDAIELLEYDDLRALCHPRLIPEEHSLDSSESESSTKIYQDHIKEAKEYIRKYCELVVLRQDSQETISNPPKSAGDYIMLLREEKENLEKERQSYYTKLHEMTLSSSEWVIIDSDDTA